MNTFQYNGVMIGIFDSFLSIVRWHILCSAVFSSPRYLHYCCSAYTV